MSGNARLRAQTKFVIPVIDPGWKWLSGIGYRKIYTEFLFIGFFIGYADCKTVQ